MLQRTWMISKSGSPTREPIPRLERRIEAVESAFENALEQMLERLAHMWNAHQQQANGQRTAQRKIQNEPQQGSSY